MGGEEIRAKLERPKRQFSELSTWERLKLKLENHLERQFVFGGEKTGGSRSDFRPTLAQTEIEHSVYTWPGHWDRQDVLQVTNRSAQNSPANDGPIRIRRGRRADVHYVPTRPFQSSGADRDRNRPTEKVAKAAGCVWELPVLSKLRVRQRKGLHRIEILGVNAIVCR